MKTADLERSKRLKELGWKQDGYFCFVKNITGGALKLPEYALEHVSTNYRIVLEDTEKRDSYTSPTAGEMIEWLLGEGWKVFFHINKIEIQTFGHIETFIPDEGDVNALADAVIWVLENKR